MRMPTAYSKDYFERANSKYSRAYSPKMSETCALRATVSPGGSAGAQEGLASTGGSGAGKQRRATMPSGSLPGSRGSSPAGWGPQARTRKSRKNSAASMAVSAMLNRGTSDVETVACSIPGSAGGQSAAGLVGTAAPDARQRPSMPAVVLAHTVSGRTSPTDLEPPESLVLQGGKRILGGVSSAEDSTTVEASKESSEGDADVLVCGDGIMKYRDVVV